MNKISKVILGLVVLALVVVGFSFNKPVSTISEVRVADPGAIGWAPFYVGMEKGIFSKHGVIVVDIPVQTGDEALKAVVSGSADVALAGILPYSFAVFEHPELKIFAQTGAAHDAQIVSNSDRGIKEPKDLKGKKIGYAKNTASDAAVHKFLESNNLSVHDVELVAVKPLAMVTSLVSGQIDAYAAWEPHVMNVRKALGEKFVIFTGEDNTYTWHPAVIATDTYLTQGKVGTGRFIEAWKEAEDYVKKNPDESIAITAHHTKVSADSLKSAWNKFDFFVAANQGTRDILSEDITWANSRRDNPAKSVPVADTLINTSFVHETAN